MKPAGKPAGEVFISFSSKDLPVGKLFSALQSQSIKVWDYSAEGQELAVGHRLSSLLKSKIDSCEYFIAVISPNSLNRAIGETPIFEVEYAIASGKAANNRLLPLLLNDPSQWLETYPELKHDPTLGDVFDYQNEDRFENTVRRICEWLAVKYVPTSLRDKRAFFSDLLLAEIEHQEMTKAEFVKLILESNHFGRHMLNEEWSDALDSIGLLAGIAKRMVPPVSLHYLLVMRGLCQLQLNQLTSAEQTFLEATTGHDLRSNPLLGLGYAGLGHTYAAMERFYESLTAFQKAVEFASDDYLHFTHQAAILNAGGKTIDESVFDIFDNRTAAPEERLKLLTLKGALHYRKREYREAIRIFRDLSVDELDENSAIFYALALKDNGEFENAVDVLFYAANRIKSTNLYHYLADTFWAAGESILALAVFEDFLCVITTPSDYARQLLVEYARMLRTIDGNDSAKARQACERAVDLTLLPPTQSKADYFFIGFAQYLLGNKEAAKFFFDNSSGFSTEYYDRLT